MTRKWIISAILVVASASGANAQLSFNESREMLGAESADEVRMGIEGLAAAGRRGVRPLVERMDSGLPTDLLVASVDALREIGHNSAGDILFRLATHRAPEVRVAALNALAACRPRGAAVTVEFGLSDMDASVRSAAASALGQLEATDAIPNLFTAFEKGVLDASSALGQLVTEDSDIERLLGYLGNVPFDSIRPAFDELLMRRNVRRPQKLQIIGRLAELATPEIGGYLGGVADLNQDSAVASAAREASEVLAQSVGTTVQN